MAWAETVEQKVDDGVVQACYRNGRNCFWEGGGNRHWKADSHPRPLREQAAYAIVHLPLRLWIVLVSMMELLEEECR